MLPKEICEVSRLDVKDGDVLVIKIKHLIEKKYSDDILERLMKALPGVTVLFAIDDMNFQVIRKISA